MNLFCVCVLVVSEQDSAAAQQYSRQGCPTGLRAQLWALILNATNEPEVTHVHTFIVHSIGVLIYLVGYLCKENYELSHMLSHVYLHFICYEFMN